MATFSSSSSSISEDSSPSLSSASTSSKQNMMIISSPPPCVTKNVFKHLFEHRLDHSSSTVHHPVVCIDAIKPIEIISSNDATTKIATATAAAPTTKNSLKISGALVTLIDGSGDRCERVILGGDISHFSHAITSGILAVNVLIRLEDFVMKFGSENEAPSIGVNRFTVFKNSQQSESVNSNRCSMMSFTNNNNSLSLNTSSSKTATFTKAIVAPTNNETKYPLVPIMSLKPSLGQQWCIKGCVENRSEVKKFALGSGSLFTFDLLDHSGEIRLVAFDSQVQRHYANVSKGSTVRVTGGVIRCTNKRFNNLDHQYEVLVISSTTIEKMVSAQILSTLMPSLNRYTKLVNLSNYSDGSLVDIIALIVDFNKSTSVNNWKEFNFIRNQTQLKQDLFILDQSTCGTAGDDDNENGDEMVIEKATTTTTVGHYVTLTIWNKEVTQMEHWKPLRGRILAAKGVVVKMGGQQLHTTPRTLLLVDNLNSLKLNNNISVMINEIRQLADIYRKNRLKYCSSKVKQLKSLQKILHSSSTFSSSS